MADDRSNAACRLITATAGVEGDQLPEVKWDEGSVLIRAVIKSNDILKLLHCHEIPVN